MSVKNYASVIVNISHENVDRPFTYAVSENLAPYVDIGTSVNIPFGSGNRLIKGIIVGFSESTDVPLDKIKAIDSVVQNDLEISDQRIQLARWIKSNYGSTMIAALKTVLPVKQKMKESIKKEVYRTCEEEQLFSLIDEAEKKHRKAQLRLLQALITEQMIPYEWVTSKLHVTLSTLQAFEKKGIIELQSKRVMRNPVKLSNQTENRPNLNESQQRIVDAVNKDIALGKPGVYLIHGVTGSGKTEVYMHLVEETIERGKQAIVLIPEIALTYQTLMRFYKRFGDRVSVMNSTLSAGEKYDQYERAKEGQIDIIIGPRSALFTPFENLGLIVIDEEHEGSYKSETMPKYHARETAVEIAKMHHAAVVLGSATPSIDSFYRAQKGEYQLFHLDNRVQGRTMASVSIVDLRKELKEGNRSILSIKLQELIQDRLDKKEQIMLFLNRRGFAGFISCRACGFVVKCPHCDVSLSLHKGNRMICHYCGYETAQYTKCPECGSKYIIAFKAGTEQVEETVAKMYPKARILRMDADTTKQKDSYERILGTFLDGEADILIGTQMIVKGHDFQNVTLVGILAADMSLFAADYRAPERTFALLTQAAGRAGRGDKKGEVIIQTYQPEHYSIRHAANQDYEGFYEEEIGYRDLMDYPPVSHMLCCIVYAKQEDRAHDFALLLINRIKQEEGSVVIGPTPAVISKVNDIFRYLFYIKNVDYNELVRLKDILEDTITKNQTGRESVLFDFDPMQMI